MTKDLNTPYGAAWHRLYDLVETRNKLLRDLQQMAGFPGNFSPATSMYWGFNYERARQLLIDAEQLEPAIEAAMREFNAEAAEIGRPFFEKRN
jgi:hypothetical protein